MAVLDGVAPKRRRDSVLLWGFLVSLALIRAGHVDERDPYWQIRAGAESLAGVPLIRPETWSWSGVEGNWYPNSPLWNILLALAYKTAGFWGFFALSAATIVLVLVMVDLLSRRLGSRPLPGLLGLFVALAASYPVLSARATLAVQVLLLFAVYVALRISDRAGTPATMALVGTVFASALGLSTLGNWLHLSFLLLGPALAGVWALIWLMTPGLTARRRWALTLSGGAGWVLGTLLSPYGLSLGLERSAAVQAACQGLITEWASPFDPNIPASVREIALFMVLVLVILAVGTVWALHRRWRSARPERALAALAMMGVPTALAGVVAIRFLGMSLLIFAPVAAALATRAVDLLRDRFDDWPTSTRLRTRLQDYSSGHFWRVVLTATLVVLLPGVVFFAAQHGQPSEETLAARLPARCHLFSSPGVGGAVVLLRPDVPVWMDGRADFFGRDTLILSTTYYGGRAQDVVPDGTTCVLLGITEGLTSGLLERLRSAPEWQVDASDGDFELWIPAAAGQG